MKKVLLSGVALLAMATSAQAEGLKLDLAGGAKAYAVYTNEDENANVDMRSFDLHKETEVHFTGEVTLDSGLTVGAHIEMDSDRADFEMEESYIYMSGGWGRVNVGEEDGVAYLLQVAAPSADSDIDGIRQTINAFNYTGAANTTPASLDYEHIAPAGQDNRAAKVSYMTPVFNGFQAGLSYIPSLSDAEDSLDGMGSDDDATQYGDAYEVAVRYEGAFEGVGLALGAGYGKYDSENTTNTVAANELTDDATTWNVGADLDFADFGFGVAYLNEESELDTNETDQDTLVIGADYTMGAYKLGASYLTRDTEIEGGNDIEIDRWTAGVSYSYGPGMSFRGAVSMFDREVTGGADTDGTQFTLGTQVKF